MHHRRTSATITVLLVVTALLVSTAIAKPTNGRPTSSVPLAKVGLYPTQVVATVKSLERVKSCTSEDAALCQDHLFLVKLRIHTTKALTAQGTVINDDESLDVISRQPIDTAS